MSIQSILFVDDSKPLVQLFSDHMSKKGHKYGFLTAAMARKPLKF